MTDITSYVQLQKEQSTNKLLKALNASVHHEILSPIKITIEVCEHLLNSGIDVEQRELIMLILFSSQFMRMHAQDFLDQRVMEHGHFAPHY